MSNLIVDQDGRGNGGFQLREYDNQDWRRVLVREGLSVRHFFSTELRFHQWLRGG